MSTRAQSEHHIKPKLARADDTRVSGMRARLMMKLITIIVMLVLTVLGARSCQGSGSSSRSPLDPNNLARNGITAICAQEQATAEANSYGSSDSTPVTAISQSEQAQLQASNPGGMQALRQALGGNLSCPTTTTTANPFGG